MLNGIASKRFGRIARVGIILAVVLLASPVLGAHAGWPPVLQAPIQSVSGAVLGTASFAPAPMGGVMVQVQVRGFDPVAGSHRLAIGNIGMCCAPFFMCSGSEVLVLPELEFRSDGSADYSTVVAGINMDWLMQPSGTAILIHADTNPTSAIIGCGVISPMRTGWPGWYPPAPPPTPVVGPPPPPGPGPHPAGPPPAPCPVVTRYRVVASSGLRLRAGPGTQYLVLRVVPIGTILEATGQEQYACGMQWVRVRWWGLHFWAAKQYLQAV